MNATIAATPNRIAGIGNSTWTSAIASVKIDRKMISLFLLSVV